MNISHLMMALSSFHILKASKVIFLPYGGEINGVPFEDRFHMANLALEDYGLDREHFSVSNFFNGKDSFVDMVSHFKRKYSQDRLCILLGEDEIDNLFRNKGMDKISYLAGFYYVGRDTNFNQDLARKYILHELPIYHIPIQSSLIREGKELLTTRKVLDYIALHKLYFCKELSSMMKESRYLHSVSVAKTAYEIARRNPTLDIEPYVAYQAGLFHDCGKDLPVEEQRKIVLDHDSEYLPCPDFALHQFVGAYLAKEKFHLSHEDVIQSIRFHCTGNGNMTEMEKLIFVADKVEPTRQFETRNARLSSYRNLDNGFLHTLRDQRDYFQRKGIPFMEHDLSKQMYQNYLKENEKHVKEN